MHTRYASALLAASCGIAANAQITLNDPENVPQVGDLFPVHKAAYMAPPPAGEGVLFDYGALVETGTGEWACIDPSTYSNAAAFPTASRALANGADTLFYQVTSSGLERVGERQQIFLYSVEVPLSDASLDLKLPLAYQDSWNDNIAATSFDVGGTPSSRIGSIHGEADAWGTLQLPGGGAPVPVLRVTTYKQEVNSVGFVTVTHHRYETSYYGQFLHAPLLRVYADSLSSTLGVSSNTSGIEWLDPSVTAVPDASPVSSMVLSPNPASSMVRVLAPGAVRMEMTDAAGRFVTSGPMRDDIAEVDLRGLQAGTYVVSTFDREGRPARQRLVVR